MKKKLMMAFGTRPEAIKLAPLILAARQRPDEFDVVVASTSQHREMLDDVLEAFGIEPDVDLNIMAPGQSLFYITARVFQDMERVLAEDAPDVIVVQGDTTTTFASAVAGYYRGARIAHVEAGLRTGNKQAPFPEEMNRKMTSCVADFHFAPTESARQNLLHEGYDDSAIFVTGNTVIDALLWMSDRVGDRDCPLPEVGEWLAGFERMVLITGHRREKFGEPFRRICLAFKRLAERNPGVAFVYPVHLNPNVQSPVRDVLSGITNFQLLPPLAYPEFIWFMKQCAFIITDSGGIQEEAPALAKPVLVTREVTERPEAVEAGLVQLVGHDANLIESIAQRLIDDEQYYAGMARGESPYGDGQACRRILDVLAGADK